ncbi:homoserine O-succinyltransferase [Hypericibacter sp.]|uniref:homoserine O-succinyltransferase n=1 Tax=Hypericibacter sp. TaxID=2705401 RepID=UPI003D6D76C1
MAIILPDGLPASAILRAEGIEVLDAPRTGGRALRVGLVNLMPDKPVTETQFARLLGAGQRDVELVLVLPATHRPRNTPAGHLADFYRPWQAVAAQGLDGLIVTGAPVELLPFAAVDYWPELCPILDWARRHAKSSFYVCWAAQAALYRFRGVGKQTLPAKLFGLFDHRLTAAESSLAKGLPMRFAVPVSRYTESSVEDIARQSGLQPLMASAESGLCLIEDEGNRAVYAFNHFEYDADTLAREYRRDLAAGEAIPMPENYFPGNNPDGMPLNSWRAVARILFRNWLRSLERPAAEISPRSLRRQAQWARG